MSARRPPTFIALLFAATLAAWELAPEPHSATGSAAGGLRTTAVATSAGESIDPAPIGERLARLEEMAGTGLLQVVHAGLADGASWAEQIEAAEVLARCTGHVHAQPVPSSAVASEAANRASQCRALAQMGSQGFHAAQRRLEQVLAGEDSPLAPTLLRPVDGTAPTPAAVAAARQRMRDIVDQYGPAAVYWLREPLSILASVDANRGSRLEVFTAASHDELLTAFDIARCMSGLPCDPGEPRPLPACTQRQGCAGTYIAALLERHGSPRPERLMEWARELMAASENGRWRELGL